MNIVEYFLRTINPFHDKWNWQMKNWWNFQFEKNLSVVHPLCTGLSICKDQSKTSPLLATFTFKSRTVDTEPRAKRDITHRCLEEEWLSVLLIKRTFVVSLEMIFKALQELHSPRLSALILWWSGHKLYLHVSGPTSSVKFVCLFIYLFSEVS